MAAPTKPNFEPAKLIGSPKVLLSKDGEYTFDKDGNEVLVSTLHWADHRNDLPNLNACKAAIVAKQAILDMMLA
ncbi:hypothetical protein INR79_09635 [Vibrio sp. SCSIO 43132]|uniref:hypothetical protein n=1 Tax=Vibrio sp. SCSIO 43132 TaxID=2779363 RepID=UPI001CA917E0|nr:hypothetical protein [Vibrio sp. SCSIO 43132]UAB68809.1 hypothetical protein INR79_09635 [Vibrio sp. SCSIO 43132]